MRLLLLCAMTGFPLAGNAEPIRAQVLGTIHKLHLDTAFQYTLSDLQNQVIAMQPNLVCGEITSKDAESTLAGYYPPENVVIEHAAKAIGAEFFASDWRGDYQDMIAAETAMTAVEEAQFNKSHDSLMSALPLGTDRMFEFLHNGAQSLIEEAHSIRMTAGTEIADGHWLARNQMIVKNCMRHAQQRGHSKVLFTYGVEHKYILEQYLREQYGIDAQRVGSLFSSSNLPMSDSIISKWRKHLSDLKTRLSSPSTPAWEVNMIKDSNRVSDLISFIDSRGVSQSK